jgi:conjugative relaxase-like TrwC/TraI family protein
VKFTITPLGGAGSTVGQVVDRIVRYLRPQPSPPLPPTAAGRPDGPSRYYADSGEEPGRWLGQAARAAGLHGEVQHDDFAAVLAGRDPHTGERLITAQGSAGRRPQLGAGNPTRSLADGEPLYGEADAAAALGVTKAEVSRMLDVGTGIALSRLVAGPGRIPGSVPGGVPGRAFGQVVGSYLVPVIDEDGNRWVTETELDRCEAARAAGVNPVAISSAGTPEDQFPIAEAARLAGVTARYLRKLASHYEDHQTEIGAAITAGGQPRSAYLVAYRGARGQWIVTRRHLVEFLERRRPPAVRVGFDLTLTTEKSLGVLALLGDRSTRRTLLDAIQGGNDWALAWLEQHAATARVGGDQVKANGWTVASFRHLTSRALDPFPHHHNVVANTVTLPDGTRRALDARGLYQHAQAASALATAEMRHQLTAHLGVRWRLGRKGGWEIDGISDRVLSEFSQRRNEIDDALRELEEAIGRGAHPGEVENIVLRTRPAKNHTPAAELLDGWLTRAAAHGFDTNALMACHGHDTPLAEPDTEKLFASVAAPDGICAGGSVFSRADALVALANHPIPAAAGETQPLLVGAARLEALTDQFLASAHVVRVAGSEDGLFTTVEMLGLQDRIMSRFHRGLHRGASLVPDSVVNVTLDRHSHLTGEQRALVESWCGSGHRFQTAIGRAGTGKTTTVAAAAEAWTAAGYRVLGAAVKGEAARTLAATTGIGCETVAWYLAHDDPHTAPLDARTVLVVDEASTLADRDLNQLMWMVATTGATLRLIGDPAQHGAIAAGGMFRVLCERHRRHTPELTITHRVRDSHDRAAAEALRAGRIDQALDHLAAAAHLHIVGDDLAMYRQVLARWWDSHRSGLDHPMVDRRNNTRRQLNRLAHLLRQVHGEIDTDEIIASSERRFSVGDRVTARAPNRDLHPPGDRTAYVRNGALGTVTGIQRHKRKRARDTITVDFDGIGAIDLPRAFFDHHRTRAGRIEVGIDHAYALTSYAVQGSTRDVSTSRVDATATRAEAYVDITRGRLANHLYLTAASDPLDGEALPRVPAPAANEAVAHRLQRSTGELTAWELAHGSETPARGRAIGL